MTKRYLGVSFSDRHQKWLACVRSGSHLFNLGHYDTPEIAARVRDVGAKLLQGPDAKLNFDGEPPAGIAKVTIQRKIFDIQRRKKRDTRRRAPF